MEIEEFDNILVRLSKRFSVERKDIFHSLFVLLADSKNLEWEGLLWDIEITYEEAEKMLSDFNFSTLTQIIEDEDNIIPQNILFQKKVRVKSKGQIWIIHKNDADPFPSNPHAHNYEQNFKLDLSNGNCYQCKILKFKIGKKELLQIREKAEKVYDGRLPPILF